mgnify:CR=1 FL=1
MSEIASKDSIIEPFEVPWSDNKFNNVLYLSSPSDDTDAPNLSWSSGAGAICSRHKELEILNKIYSERNYASDKREDCGTTPLKDIFKGRIVNNLDNINDEYFAKVINPSYNILDNKIKSFVFSKDQTTNDQMVIKAAQRAIITRRLLSNWGKNLPLILLSGGKEEGQYFINALKSVWENNNIPKVSHCIRGDSYYPGHLLTSLISYHQYHLMRDDRRGKLLRSPLDENQVSPTIWKRAVKGASKPHSYDYYPLELNSMEGDNVAERIYCWKKGIVCLESPQSFSVDPATHQDALKELKNACFQKGYADLGTFVKLKTDRYL